ncbi:MAG: hypothetical protein WBL50_05175 [Candidatus Acidiferrum sp.]
MLQAVHQEKAVARASSIFCRWIREERGERVRLVAVWMDSEMRCFEPEFVSHGDGEELCQDAMEEPGGIWAIPTRGWTGIIEIPSNRS